jgi:uncharacterized protein (TIRG00374 family)
MQNIRFSPQQKTFIRALCSLVIAGLIIYQIVIRSQVNITLELQECKRLYGLMAFIFYGMALGIGILRWNLLLRAQQVQLSLRETTRLYMIGVFFNLLIPGSVGGDLIKMVYIARAYPQKKAAVILTIVLDRIIGILGLFFIATLSVILSWNYIQQSSDALKLGTLTVGVGSIVGILIMGMIAAWPHLGQNVVITRFSRTLKEFLPSRFIDQLERISAAFALFGKNLKIMGLTLFLSLGVHLIMGLEVYTIGKSFHEENVTFKQNLLFTQIANCASAIPITPSGIGSRDLVLSVYLHEAGAAREKTGIIPTMFTLIVMFWSLIGGLYFVAGGKHYSRKN